MRTLYTLGMVALLALGATACGREASAQQEGGAAATADPLAERAKDPRVLLIDVRTPGEFAGGALPGAVNIPVGQEARMAELIGEKDRPVIVYCRSGNRSGQSLSKLTQMGFTAVSNGGGANELSKRLGQPLVK